MTLWCISRAPLMFGGHLPWNDDFTLSLITNDEVLAVDRSSSANRQLFRTNDLIAWIADVPDSHDRYVALFNAQDSNTNRVTVNLSEIGFHGSAQARDLWSQKNLGTFKETFSQDLPPHAAALFRLKPEP
jgi:hypothetical protein